MNIEYVNIIDSDTPAQLDIPSATIFVNRKHFDHLPKAYQDFILAHEEGHYMLRTWNEFEADKYAFDKLAGSKPGSLKAIIDTIGTVLDGSMPEHFDRFAMIYRHAMRYNFEKTGDRKFLDEIEAFNKKFDEMKKASGPAFYGYDKYLMNARMESEDLGYDTCIPNEAYEPDKTVTPNSGNETLEEILTSAEPATGPKTETDINKKIDAVPQVTVYAFAQRPAVWRYLVFASLAVLLYVIFKKK